MKRQITIIRHATAIKNLEDRHGGKGSNLAPHAAREIGCLVQNLKAKKIPHGTLFYSPVIHAKETARMMSNLMATRAEPAPLIRPLDFGLVAGLRTTELKIQFPDVAYRLEQWRRGELEAVDLNLPGAESFSGFWERGVEFLNWLPEGQSFVIGTRSVIVLLGNILRGSTPVRGGGYKEIEIKNCDFFTFESLDGGWQFRSNLSSLLEGKF